MRLALLALLVGMTGGAAAPVWAQGSPSGPGRATEPSAAAPQAPSAADPGAQRAPPAVSYVIVDGAGVADPLTDTPPDPERGRAVFTSKERGDCVACHRLGDQGATTGPALDGVGVRLTVGALRLWVINPAALKDVENKPAFYSVFDPPPGAAKAQTRLTAQEVEDLVAFLAAQR